ncbi:IQ domain-containing protein IQM2-like [Henckelia pumila]|uniref:IQ domain-containing protein IQM2-like n=1 Tax=Henckelia pumila TaxID=405737 RepID=UPI003C6DB931
MGVSWSCPLGIYRDLENAIESVFRKSINLGDDAERTPIRAVSFEDEHEVLPSFGSGKLLVEGSSKNISKITRTMIYSKVPEDDNDICQNISPLGDPSSPKHVAAVKLQKVYKSFRTRRKLADCAVLVEQSWWKVLDFAELKHSSVSFFDLEKHETAISRWSRARTRAAKVGKGLSKNGKAQKLALQHWLEAIDPRHRYGHNLHFYYVKWLNSQSKEPFFYWLDIGEGKELNLMEKCPRSKLQQQCIKYLGPMERKAYEVAVEDGYLLYRETGELLDTTRDPTGAKWIFVLSTSRTLYVGKKKKGSFQHSSFLAGGATLAAGRIVAERGILKAIWPHSGHYRPTPENFLDFISFLRESNLDLTDVKLDSTDDEEEDSIGKKDLKSNSSEDDLDESDHMKGNSYKHISGAKEIPGTSGALIRKPTSLLIPSKHDVIETFERKTETTQPNNGHSQLESPIDGNEDSEERFNSNLEKADTSKDQHLTKEGGVPEQIILQRINSHRETKSYQLGKQLSCKWSTGAGPRIGCLRDYPSELQSHALEHVNLSPRSERCLRFDFWSRASTPTGSILSRSDSHCLRTQSLPVNGPADSSC